MDNEPNKEAPAAADAPPDKGADAPAPAAADAPAVPEPAAQAGDPEPEVARPVAQPVFQSIEEGRGELDANPGRTSVLTNVGVLVREP